MEIIKLQSKYCDGPLTYECLEVLLQTLISQSQRMYVYSFLINKFSLSCIGEQVWGDRKRPSLACQPVQHSLASRVAATQFLRIPQIL